MADPHHHHDHASHGHDHEGHDHASHAHHHDEGDKRSWWRSLFAHDHGSHGRHYHDHAGAADFGRAFAIGTALNLGFVLAEFGFGLAANSLALVADAAHNLSDALGLLAAWFATWLGRFPPRGRHTYGYRRASIMAALFNAALLIGTIAIIIFEACRRLLSPQPVEEWTVILVAALGIVINFATALLFLKSRERDLNARGAYAHMMADAAVSAGVVVSGFLIAWSGALWIDPLVSLFIGVVILVGSWRLTRDTVDMALDVMPSNLDRGEIEKFLGGLPGVRSVHDLHVWSMSTTETALTAHIVREDAANSDGFLAQARDGLRRGFQIPHVTLQVESGDPEHPCVDPCEARPDVKAP